VSSMSRRLARAVAAALAAGLALSACSTMKLGAAAVTNNGRITTGALTADVASLNAAYADDKAKHLSPQRPVGQETQQVLSWLILFKVYDEVAAQNGISVTNAQQQQAVSSFQSQASAHNLSLAQFLSAGGALPPNLVPQFMRAAAIQAALANKIDGGVSPRSQSGQAALNAQLSRFQCMAAKNLNLSVNPQYGQFDYTTYAIVLVPPSLAANAVPAPTPSLRANPPC
jgi:hypothetical protein